MDRIGDWSRAELRRYIVNLLLNDPGALPPSDAQTPLSAGTSKGQGLVWDGFKWVPSTNNVYDNSTDQSLFLQLTAAAKRKIAFGTGTATITNGTSKNSGNIAHGLGVLPTIVIGSALQTADLRDDYVVDIVGFDATNVNLSVRGAAAEQFAITNPTTVTFYWLAIG